MYAIIRTGGKQYRVAPEDEIQIELLKDVDGSTIVFDQVLAVKNDDGLVVGTPTVEGAAVTAELLEIAKGPKVIVYKYKAKKDYRRKQGHRQPFMKVKITAINA